MKPVLTLAALLFPAAALAHPGGHGGFTLGRMMAHMTSEPDHVAVVLAVLVLGGALCWRAWSRR
jgi:hypothetical protein